MTRFYIFYKLQHMAGSKEGLAYWGDKAVAVVTDPLWGDNGKGKIVDEASQYVEMVARYNGGPNSGHTVKNERGKFVFHGVPSGILNPEVLCIISTGSVVNPISLGEEITELRKIGVEISASNLLISRDSHLIMPWHRMRDNLQETVRGGNKIGTTGQGIGPTYSDRALRTGFRVKDLLNPQFEEMFDKELLLQERLSRFIRGEPLISDLYIEELDGQNTQMIAEMVRLALQTKYYDHDAILEQIREAKDIIGPMVTYVLPVIWDYKDKGKKIVGEAGQGALLDLDSEAFPYVTSSHPTAAGFTMATGIQGKEIDAVIGVTKGYSTRVGKGPMPSELHDEIGEYIQTVGEEWGATTGRRRRVGWLDIPATRYGIKIGGIDTIALTKIDVLDELDKIGICVAYEVDGQRYNDMPSADPDFMSKAKPIVELLPGWRKKTSGIRAFEALPVETKQYVNRVQEYLGKPINIVSNGPEREAIIYS